MKTNTLSRSAASPLATSVRTREQFGMAPTSPRQGSALPFAGYPTTGAMKASTVATAGTAHAATTLAAVRKDADGRVPPRGRPV